MLEICDVKFVGGGGDYPHEAVRRFVRVIYGAQRLGALPLN